MTKIKIGNYYLVGEDYSENRAGSDYIKIENSKGEELLYWDEQEFRDNPVNTIGAILGALKELEVKTRLQQKFHSQEEYGRFRDRVILEGNRANFDEELNHWNELEWLVWDNSVEELF